MFRAPHFAHPALPEPLDQSIAAELARATHFLAQFVDHARADVAQHDDEQVRKDDVEEKLVAGRTEGGALRQHHEADHRSGTELTAASMIGTALQR